MTIEAYAKVNLSLEVFDRRPDGYHALRSLVLPISLADSLDIDLASDGTLTSNTGFADDLCIKAAKALCEVGCSSVRTAGARIRVTKRIPVGGGLGGGSADAAAVLRALNALWNLGKTPEELAAIGAQVGSDVPALVLAQHYRRTVLMEGRGERVSLCDRSVGQSVHLVLANPGIAVSTAEIFRLCVPRTEPAQGWVNDLQEPAVRRHPEIARTLAALKDAGATDVRMSGSGATCFGFVRDAREAERVCQRISAAGFRGWVAESLNQKRQ